MNKILIGFNNGREIKLEAVYSPKELYELHGSDGFIKLDGLVFQIADVSYIVDDIEIYHEK